MQDYWSNLNNDHGKDSGVDQVLHPVADGVDGIEATVLGGAGVGLVLTDQNSSLGDWELEVR